MPALAQTSLLGKVKMTSTLLVQTGLHIGGGGESLDIGGIDKIVVRDPITFNPYLPGSSLKGKLRSILERLFNKPLNRQGSRDTYRYESDDLEDGYSQIGDRYVSFQGANRCPVSRVFGSTGNDCFLREEVVENQKLDKILKSDGGVDRVPIDGIQHVKVKGRNRPASLIVRDCHLLEESADELKKVDTGLYMTEWKFENGIDRVTSAANPRQVERVPAGAKFHFEMIYTVTDFERAHEDLRNLAVAMAILEDDALGGHGSRGYGKIRFENIQFFYRDLSHYQYPNRQGSSKMEPMETFETVEKLLDGCPKLDRKLLEGEGEENG